MTPEASDYLKTARWALEQAGSLLADGHYEIASREAYSVALNAARALIFEKSEIATKTHSGTRAQLHKLILEGLHFPAELAAFLARGFDLKQRVDYGPVLSRNRADTEEFVQEATAFLAAVQVHLGKDG